MSERVRPLLLLVGSNGQVGGELARSLATLGDVRAFDRTALDLSDPDAVRAVIRTYDADVIVNAAAYTQVDRAKTEPALAQRINGDAPAVLAAEAARAGALLVQFSTDYVFSGTASRPYAEGDTPEPQSVYGSSKLQGDRAVLQSDADAYVFRIGWIYGCRGKSLLGTIQRLALERDELRVVGDQHGGPTWSRAVAELTTRAVGQWLDSRRSGRIPPARGVYHMAPPDHTTWHEFASAIVAAMPIPEGRARPTVRAISTAEYPTAAVRPAWSVLDSRLLRDTFGLELPPWRIQLAECLRFGQRAGI